MEPAQRVWFRAALRARLRGGFRDARLRDGLLADAGLSDRVRREMPAFPRFGALWAFVERHGARLARRRMAWDEMRAELPRLEALRDQAAGRAGREAPAVLSGEMTA